MERAPEECRTSRARRAPTWQTIATIAAKLSVSERTVQRATSELVERELLVVIDNSRDNGCRRNAASIFLLRDAFEVDWLENASLVHEFVVAKRREYREAFDSWNAPYPNAVERTRWNDDDLFDPTEYEFNPIERARWRNDDQSRVLKVRGHEWNPASSEARNSASETSARVGGADASAEGATTAELALLRGDERGLGGLAGRLGEHRIRRSHVPLDVRIRDVERRAERLVAEARSRGWDAALRAESRREVLG